MMGEIVNRDRVNLNDIREDVREVYADIFTLDDYTIRVLCSMLIVIHNHWNWEELYQQLKPKEGNHGTGN